MTGKAGDGEKQAGQELLMEKVLHGSEGYASNLDLFLEGKGVFEMAFVRHSLENNREGNELRKNGSMLELRELLHSRLQVVVINSPLTLTCLNHHIIHTLNQAHHRCEAELPLQEFHLQPREGRWPRHALEVDDASGMHEDIVCSRAASAIHRIVCHCKETATAQAGLSAPLAL